MSEAAVQTAPSARAVRFVRRGAVRTLDAVDPNLTVLRYLREVEGSVGTKEGCAEGDCGACTVVLGELDNGRIRYRAVNSCIQFVPTLDGKALYTVEDLEASDGALHPVQQALVDNHGSQCGFCTPGFVMSLFALYKSDVVPTRKTTDDALAGNLCRCTGYRPIVAAAAEACGRRQADRFSESETATIALLQSIARDDTLTVDWKGRRYLAPVTEDALAELVLAQPEAVLVAGATDAGLWVTKEHRDLDTLIYTGGVRELLALEVSESQIEIGAAVSYSEAMGAIAAHYPSFGELIRRLGSVQIRNAGTIGGNVANASPIGDTLPPLVALDASVVLRRGEERREMPLDGFFLDYRKTALRPGEFLCRIRLPLHRDRAFRVYKISKRFDQDISGACGAFSLALEGPHVRDIRICFGGMAATPKRACHAEQALRHREWSEASVRSAMAAMERDYAPIDDMRASGAYRRLVAGNLLYKFYLETTRCEDIHVLAYGT